MHEQCVFWIYKILKERRFENLIELFHLHNCISSLFLVHWKMTSSWRPKKSFFRFLESLHFGSLLYFYSIFLCPPFPLGILMNQNRSLFSAQFLRLLPRSPVSVYYCTACNHWGRDNKRSKIFAKKSSMFMRFSLLSIIWGKS